MMQRRLSSLEELGFNGESPAAGTRRLAGKIRGGSPAEKTLAKMLAAADIVAGGDRPWDIQIHNSRFYQRALADGTLGFGESYMDGWWDCEALDELCCRAIRARLEESMPVNLNAALSVAGAVLLNLQTRHRTRKIAERHYDLGNEFFQAMLDPEMQYSPPPGPGSATGMGNASAACGASTC